MKLADAFSLIRNGASIKQYDNAVGIPITRIETIANRVVDRSKCGYADIFDIEKYQDYVLQDGDILMSHINSVQHLGKTALYSKKDGEVLIHGMNLLVLRPKREMLEPNYAYIALNSLKFLRQLPRITQKSVNQASFSVNDLKQTDIDVPSLSKQKEIAHNVMQIDRMITNRQQELSVVDELVKSRFVEMFGDPVTNPMGWKTASIRDTSELISDGPFGSNLKSSHYVDDGIRVIRLGNIGAGKFLDDDKAYISEEHYKTLKKYTCHAGEIVIGTLGEPNLRACLIPDDIVVSVNKSDCVHFIPNADILNNIYACAYLNTDGALQLAQGSLHGQTRSRIAMSQVAALPIMLPPITIQNQFADFVQQVDKSKLAVQQSIETLQTLKAKLMQDYFS